MSRLLQHHARKPLEPNAERRQHRWGPESRPASPPDVVLAEHRSHVGHDNVEAKNPSRAQVAGHAKALHLAHLGIFELPVSVDEPAYVKLGRLGAPGLRVYVGSIHWH